MEALRKWKIALSRLGLAFIFGGLLALVSGLAFLPVARAQMAPDKVASDEATSWVQISRMTAANGANSDRFGSAVDLSTDGETAVVGSPAHSTGGVKKGSVYVYVRPDGGWQSSAQFTVELTVGDGSADDLFGTSVAVSEDGGVIAVGAPGYGAGGTLQGAVYLYVRPASGWASTSTYTARLTTGVAGDRLGQSVALNGDGSIVAAGAPQTGMVDGKGAAFIFTQPSGGWTTTTSYQARMVSRDGQAGDRLGQAVSLSSDGAQLAAGAPGAKVGEQDDQGVIYVFVRGQSAWVDANETARITTNEGNAGDLFGSVVVISANGATLAASSPFHASNTGAVYVYSRPSDGWKATNGATALLVSNDSASGDLFGASLGISENGARVLIGAPNHAAGGLQRGAIYAYTKSDIGWLTTNSYEGRMVIASGADEDHFGASLAVMSDGGTAISAAPDENAGGVDRGALYVFDLLQAPQFKSTQHIVLNKKGEALNIDFKLDLKQGRPAPVFSVSSGSLPPGMTLSADGVLKGTPSAFGEFEFTLIASNNINPAGSQQVIIRVYAGDVMVIPLILYQ